MELDSADKQLLQRAISDLDKANGVMRFLSDHFRDKYRLNPNQVITPDGRILTPETMVVSNGIGSLQAIAGSENG